MSLLKYLLVNLTQIPTLQIDINYSYTHYTGTCIKDCTPDKNC